MTRAEFHERLNAIGLTCADFAALIGRAQSTVHDFGGRSPIPYHVRLIVRLLEERRSIERPGPGIPSHERR